jgi:FlaA1/EpsC-like NDP-sugar epimerase
VGGTALGSTAGDVRKSTSEALRNLHLLLDAGVVVVALWMAPTLHAALQGSLPALLPPPPPQAYGVLPYVTPPLWVLLVVALRLNRTFEEARPLAALLSGLFVLHAIGLFALSSVQFLVQSSVSRSLAAAFSFTSFALMFGLRVVLNQWARYQHGRGLSQPRLVFVGRWSQRMADFARDAATRPFPPRLLGYLSPATSPADASLPPADPEPFSHLGVLNPERLRALLHDEAVDEVLFFAPLDTPEAAPDSVAVCEELGIPASFAVTPASIASHAARVTSICEVFDHEHRDHRAVRIGR